MIFEKIVTIFLKNFDNISKKKILIFEDNRWSSEKNSNKTGCTGCILKKSLGKLKNFLKVGMTSVKFYKLLKKFEENFIKPKRNLWIVLKKIYSSFEEIFRIFTEI